jgi:hypothetical protein
MSNYEVMVDQQTTTEGNEVCWVQFERQDGSLLR